MFQYARGTETDIGVFSNRQPGRLPGDFDNRLAPECQEQVQMKLKIQMEPIELIQMEPIESIQMEPIESIQMKLKILGNFWAFLLIVRVLLIKCFQFNELKCTVLLLSPFS